MPNTLAAEIERTRFDALLPLVRESLDRRGLGVCNHAAERLAAWGALLLQHSEQTNLVGIREPQRFVDELLVDNLEVVPLLTGTGRWIDVGAGAGLPGIPLALALPSTNGVLLEPRQLRVQFLQTSRRVMGLSAVVVLDRRLEQLDQTGVLGAPPYDLAVSRAVFAPAQWLAEGLRLVRRGGHVAVWCNGGPDALWEQIGRTPGDPLVQVRGYTLREGAPRTVALVQRG